MVLKSLLVIIAVSLVVFTGMLMKLAADSRAMSPGLGLQDGRLAPCPESPNCVSSDASPSDMHYIAPYTAADEQAWSRLIAQVSDMKGADTVAMDGSYARFAFKTPLLGFVDDVEFSYRPEAGEIAVRSASRVGYGDMNTNRKRIETIRALLN